MSNWKQGLLGILLMAFQINNRLLLVLVLLFTVSCSQVLSDDTNSFSRYFQTHSVILLYSKLNFGGIHLKYSHRVSRIYLFFFSEHQDICSHWALWPISFLHPWLSQLHWQGFQDLICKGISTPWDLHLILSGQVLRSSVTIIYLGFQFPLKRFFALFISVQKCFSLENEKIQS